MGRRWHEECMDAGRILQTLVRFSGATTHAEAMLGLARQAYTSIPLELEQDHATHRSTRLESTAPRYIAKASNRKRDEVYAQS